MRGDDAVVRPTRGTLAAAVAASLASFPRRAVWA